MNQLNTLYEKMIENMQVNGLKIPLTAVKFFKKEETVPDWIKEYETKEISITSCQASKQASLGDAVLLTLDNIGCIAAAITFGLVDKNEDQPLVKPRVYTEIMRNQAQNQEKFTPPTPRDFTRGLVYACSDSGHYDYCLFGKEDSGRFKTAAIARKAINEMTAVQPPVMQGVFFYSKDLEARDIEPDVIVLTVRPVELTRLVQAYQFNTGERMIGSMGAVRVVNSDLIVRPYLTGQPNFSSFCIGARLIAEYNPNHLGMGMPFSIFKTIVSSLEESKTGYPFYLYPGAKEV